MIRHAQRVTKDHPSADLWRLRVDGNSIPYAIFEYVTLSNEAIAAGMESQGNIVNVVIYGNALTDPTIASSLEGDNFQISNDGSATFQDAEVMDVIRNDGQKWLFRVKL